MSDAVEAYIAGTVSAVEATRMEQAALYERWHKEYGKPWEETTAGFLVTVGHYYRAPVCISISQARVDGRQILFWYATSQVVDYRKISDWLEKHLPGAAQVDADNFHNA